MPLTVFFAIIFAAFLHAIWNAMVKKGDDKYISLTAVVLGHIPISIAVIFFTPIYPFRVFLIFLFLQYFFQGMSGVSYQPIDWKIIQKFIQ